MTGAGAFTSAPTPFGGHLYAVASGVTATGPVTFVLGADGAVLRR